MTRVQNFLFNKAYKVDLKSPLFCYFLFGLIRPFLYGSSNRIKTIVFVRILDQFASFLFEIFFAFSWLNTSFFAEIIIVFFKINTTFFAEIIIAFSWLNTFFIARLIRTNQTFFVRFGTGFQMRPFLSYYVRVCRGYVQRGMQMGVCVIVCTTISIYISPYKFRLYFLLYYICNMLYNNILSYIYK